MTSLYDRLGGVYSIATVIDDFIDRIMVDPRLNANPKVDEAHHRVPPASRHGDGLLGRRRTSKVHGPLQKESHHSPGHPRRSMKKVYPPRTLARKSLV